METPSYLSSFTERARVRLVARPHAIVWVTGCAWLLWAALLANLTRAVYLAFIHTSYGALPTVVLALGSLLTVQALLAGITGLLRYHLSYLLITDSHIVTLTGLARQIRALPLTEADIRGVDETLLGRALGYGTLQIRSFSGQSPARFPIANPTRALAALSPLHDEPDA